jgi:hypothetical protein
VETLRRDKVALDLENIADQVIAYLRDEGALESLLTQLGG